MQYNTTFKSLAAYHIEVIIGLNTNYIKIFAKYIQFSENQ